MTSLDCTRFQHCNKCGLLKPLTAEFFHRHPEYVLGFIRTCRACKSAYDKEYREVNRERLRKQGVDYRKSRDRERHREYERRYREKNRERINGYQAEWRERNREQVRTYSREWVAANRERNRLHQIKMQHKRRGWKLEQVGEPYTVDDILQMYDDQQGLCAYCETPLFGTYHVDHMIPLSRGGLDGWNNLAVACPHCNISKHVQTAEEYMTRCTSKVTQTALSPSKGTTQQTSTRWKYASGSYRSNLPTPTKPS